MKRRSSTPVAVAAIGAAARPLGSPAEDEAVVDWIGDASVVLLGEATHGTREFYAMRAWLTRRLVERCGFSAVAIEGDWPDVARVDRHVRGREDGSADAALAGFRRFPTWMWRNATVRDFVRWLREWNRARPAHQRVGFHGLDLYSLNASMQAVVDYLAARDPIAARAARDSYACFEQYGNDAETYAWAAGRLGEQSCEDAVVRELTALYARRAEWLGRDPGARADEFFDAGQNARLARNAERYYRAMVRGRHDSWNVRDRHMAETVAELREHLRNRGRAPRIVVWAHNSHLGDARATEMGEAGELNLGQLAREAYGDEVRSIGFTTGTGTVIAARDWGGRPECMSVRPALPGSYEELLHEVGRERFFLPLAAGSEVASALAGPRLERAIGVIYRPDTERHSHYFHARLPAQFDAVIHLDETHAVEPLDETQPVLAGELPDTFPTGT